MEQAHGADMTRQRVDSGTVVDLDGVPRRLPKLAVRNKVTDAEAADGQMDSAVSDAESRSGSSGPSQSSRVATPLSAGSWSEDSVHRLESANPDSATSRPSTSATQTTKKKKGGMLKFLTLKEPSTAAWAEFAEAEKQKAKQKDLIAPKSRTSGVSSSQKLPDYVPKVNSKWDGLPENAKRKSEDSKGSSRAKRNSLISNTSRPPTWATTSSLVPDSRATDRSFAPWSLSSQPGRDSSSQGSRTQPPALALVPDPDAVEMTDDNKPQTFLRPPSPPQDEPQSFLPESILPLSPPELEGDDLTHIHELDTRMLTPELYSPRTPPGEGSDSRPALMGIHYREEDSPQPRPSLSRSETSWYDDTIKEAVTAERESPEPVRQPVNFSRPRVRSNDPPAVPTRLRPHLDFNSGRSTLADEIVLSPTLKGRSGRIDPFLTDTFASHSRETGHIPQRVASTLIIDPDLIPRPISPPPKSPRRQDIAPMSPVSPIESNGPRTYLPTGLPRAMTPEAYVPLGHPRAMTPETTITSIYNPETAHIRSRSETSLAPSVTPSELSEQWQMSPKERLGLGANVRRRDILPWETAEGILDGEEIVPGPRSPGLIVPETRSKRMSWRLSQKR